MILTAMTLLAATMTASPPVDDLATVAKLIQQPSKEYTSGPLWVWNDMLSPEQVVEALDVLAKQHIRQVWVHPRPGLMTPYLSNTWFQLWEATLAAARERDMLVWIYDENSYPSGFAGGNVPEIMPESRGLGLTIRQEDKIKMPHDGILAVYRIGPEGFQNVTQELSDANAIAEGNFLIVREEQSAPSPWFGGKTYVDLLRPGVTEQFLAVTLDTYKDHFASDFGVLIPGSFTDEPHLKPCGDIHLTPDLPEQYRQRWNEDFWVGLPHLRQDTDAGRRFRHHYLCTLNELFVERWAKPYFNYCAKNNLEFTGHYWEHEWPNCASVPDNMSMSFWQQRPGIDTLFNQYAEGPHAQFGNVRAVIELASVARQGGRSRTLCEAYGGSSAEMRFEDYKRIGDWLQVLGVNTINEHLSDISIRGARKRDYPPTFSQHSPWMQSYHVLVDYFARISCALSQGKQINRCLILEPTTTAWMHHFTDTGRLDAIGEGFQAYVTKLAKAQLAFDLGSEAIVKETGTVAEANGLPALKVGECAYTAVVIPAEMESINLSTFDLLKSFLDQGGKVFSCAPAQLPSHLDGAPAEVCATLRSHPNWTCVTADESAARIEDYCKPTLRVRLAPENQGIVYHHRRQLSDGDILFLVNSSNEHSASGRVWAGAAVAARRTAPETGAITAYPVTQSEDSGIEAAFTLPPCGSLMLFLDKTTVPAGAPPAVSDSRVPVAISAIEAQRLDDNNLILDYMDVTAGAENASGVYFKKAADITFQQHGLRGNIWDHCVQFRDTLLRTEFPDDSGFEARYHFSIEGAVPERLHAVIERADLYSVSCNGVPLTPEPDTGWLDKTFSRLDIAQAAIVGENELIITARPMTIFHELEAAHIVGDFSLKSTDRGFVIIPPVTLSLGPWTRQGLPLYGLRVAYTASVKITEPEKRYAVLLPSWNGVVARVVINGEEAGHIYRHPMECDITAQLRPGANTIQVILCGSLRNTLGPHFGEGSTGLTHPGSWNNAPESGPPPGNEYFNIGYGLLSPFEVVTY